MRRRGNGSDDAIVAFDPLAFVEEEELELGRCPPGLELDDQVVDVRLVDRRIAFKGACVFCGCSNLRACQTPEGPCFWVLPRVCSRCWLYPHTGHFVAAESLYHLAAREGSVQW